MLDKYKRLPLKYPSKIGYNSLIQTVILKELINIIATAKTDLVIELKMKIRRIKYLEGRLMYNK